MVGGVDPDMISLTLHCNFGVEPNVLWLGPAPGRDWEAAITVGFVPEPVQLARQYCKEVHS